VHIFTFFFSHTLGPAAPVCQPHIRFHFWGLQTSGCIQNYLWSRDLDAPQGYFRPIRSISVKKGRPLAQPLSLTPPSRPPASSLVSYVKQIIDHIAHVSVIALLCAYLFPAHCARHILTFGNLSIPTPILFGRTPCPASSAQGPLKSDTCPSLFRLSPHHHPSSSTPLSSLWPPFNTGFNVSPTSV
jgi:hypothetical protein